MSAKHRKSTDEQVVDILAQYSDIFAQLHLSLDSYFDQIVVKFAVGNTPLPAPIIKRSTVVALRLTVTHI